MDPPAGMALADPEPATLNAKLRADGGWLIV